LKEQKESSSKIIEEKNKELDRTYEIIKKQNRNWHSINKEIIIPTVYS
jgi:hypothetical protein